MKNTIEKVLFFLRARTRIGGLEISDTALRFAYFKNGALRVAGLRLPPGIVEQGEVKNPEQLVEALKNFRQQIPTDFPRKKPCQCNCNVEFGSHLYPGVYSAAD